MLKIDDRTELMALIRALIESKFCEDPSDDEVAASPLVSAICQRAVECLAQDGKMKKRMDWLKVEPGDMRWKQAISRAVKARDFWKKASQEEKSELARILLSPFSVADASWTKFIVEVDQMIETGQWFSLWLGSQDPTKILFLALKRGEPMSEKPYGIYDNEKKQVCEFKTEMDAFEWFHQNNFRYVKEFCGEFFALAEK